jgi:arylsulfatase A-like enzyme
MVADGRWKLIRTLASHYYVEAVYLAAGAAELYDLEADPREEHDQAARRPDVVRALDAHLGHWTAAHDGARDIPPPAALPPERERELRALGYLE